MGEKKVKLEKAKKEKKEKKAEAKKAKDKKPKKKFSKNNFLGITLAGVAVLAGVYAFVYLDYQAKTEAAEQSNAELVRTLAELEEYYNNMDKYKAEIEATREAISKVMSEFPADAREEDVIMLAVQMQEKNAIIYDGINIEEGEALYAIPENEIKAAEIEGMSKELAFMQRKGTYQSTTNYDNLKGCIEQIYKSANRIGIEEIMYSKNEENGTLSGNIVLNFYSAKGTGKEYVAPDIAAYLSGTPDLFRTDKAGNAGGEEGGAADGDNANAKKGADKNANKNAGNAAEKKADADAKKDTKKP